ncbi:MAG: SUMF1/EgtB/PvdO family nonheme iron enzyme, partial [Bacteroidales bacterium]|nr:SUMF1/EgtB/PvdO family nonheme iron enzyme [Candidatus Colimorpha onthohippi]
AKDFIDKLGMKVAGQLSGEKFRLPTAAEWDCAARGGKKSQHTIYAGSNDANEVAWNNTNLTKQSTVPMCQKKPNELGLYDMSGNVNEWCLDWRKKYLPEEVIDPVGKAFLGSKRVVRGGSWNGPASSCRVSFRDGRDPDTRSSDVGIRLVLS